VLRGERPRPSHSRAFMLRDKTVGLIGYGSIARAVTRGCRLGHADIDVVAHTGSERRRRMVELDALLRDSDVVCVLLTLNAGTRGLLDATRLRMMKPVRLVNTARGGIIDEALWSIWRASGPRCASPRYVAIEPLRRTAPCATAEHHFDAAHARHTVESHAVLPGVAVDAITRVLAGEPPRYVRNPRSFPSGAAVGAVMKPYETILTESPAITC